MLPLLILLPGLGAMSAGFHERHTVLFIVLTRPSDPVATFCFSVAGIYCMAIEAKVLRVGGI